MKQNRVEYTYDNIVLGKKKGLFRVCLIHTELTLW